MIHSTEKNLKEHGSKISEAEKKAIETAVSDLRNSLKGTNTEEIKKNTQSLIQASMKLGEAVYRINKKVLRNLAKIRMIKLIKTMTIRIKIMLSTLRL